MLQSSVSATRRVQLVCVACRAADSGAAKTKVKFQLQRKCMFGEHFKVVGAHSTLGEWRPEAGVPLEWSDGHTWTTELEVPQGEEYEFKFLLQCVHGGVHWQPGPNRVFSTLEGPVELVVSQSWEFVDECDVAPVMENQDTSSDSEKQNTISSDSEKQDTISSDSEEPATEPQESVSLEPDNGHSSSDPEEPVTEEPGNGHSVTEEQKSVLLETASDHSNAASEEPVTEELEVKGVASSSEETKMEPAASSSVYESQEAVDAMIVDSEVNTSLTLWRKDRFWFQSALSRLVSIFRK